jgi:hypothetical protein
VSTSLKPESIDRHPLDKVARREFETDLLARPDIKSAGRHLLEVILRKWHWGKADCFPSNPQIAKAMGRTVRCVQQVLAYLETGGVIITAIDRSITVQRRIIIVDHPHAADVLAELRANPNVIFSSRRIAAKSQESAPKGDIPVPKTRAPRGDISTPQSDAPRDEKIVHLGMKKEVHLGVSNFSPEPLNRLSSESLTSKTGGEREISEGNGERSLAPLAQGPPDSSPAPAAGTCCDIARRWLNDPWAPEVLRAGARKHLARCGLKVTEDIPGVCTIGSAVQSEMSRMEARKARHEAEHSPPPSPQPVPSLRPIPAGTNPADIEVLRQLACGAPRHVFDRALAVLCRKFKPTDSGDYQKAYEAVLNDVRIGAIHPGIVHDAFLSACDPSTKNPGRRFKAQIDKGCSSRAAR